MKRSLSAHCVRAGYPNISARRKCANRWKSLSRLPVCAAKRLITSYCLARRVWAKPRSRISLRTNLEAGDVLFIDEIHRLSPAVEEILYPALEDYQIDIMIGEGPAARSV